MYVYMRSSLKQLEPKSMILMLLLLGCFSSIFSGFKSQWITWRQISKPQPPRGAASAHTHLLLLEVAQADEHLEGEAADEGQRQPLELIVLDELVPVPRVSARDGGAARKRASTHKLMLSSSNEMHMWFLK